MQLTELTLTNFAGIKSLTIAPGQTTDISGPNGAGKTTIGNALVWLLTGKNIEGDSDFEVKTTGLHNVDHNVTATVILNEKQYVLSRTLREKWTNKKGAQEAELSGHETDFYIDNVPYKKADFEKFVSDNIATPDVIQMLMLPGAFNRLNWKERRQILFQIAGEVSDLDIAQKNDYTDLAGWLEKTDIDTVRDHVKTQKRDLKKEMDQIPGKINEHEAMRPDKAEIDKARKDLEDVQKQISELDDRIQGEKTKHQEVTEKRDALYKELDKLKEEKRQLEQERTELSRKKYKEQISEYEEKISQLDVDLKSISDEWERLNSSHTELNRELSRINSDLEASRKEYQEIYNEKVEPGESELKCPTCKRPYENADPETIREQHNKRRSERLEEVTEKGRKLKEQYDSKYYEVQGVARKINETRQQHDEKKSERQRLEDEMNAVQAPGVEVSEREKTVDQEIGRVNRELEDLVIPNDDAPELKKQRKELEDHRDALNKRIAREEENTRIDARIKELEEQQNRLAEKFTYQEKLEHQINEVTKQKIDMVDERLSEWFAPVRFRMFEEQLNGGLVPACETVLNGRTWSEMSTGERIKAGLTIIRGLQKHYGIVLPVVIDNHEAVTDSGSIEMPDIDGQKIKMYAREGKDLEINVE